MLLQTLAIGTVALLVTALPSSPFDRRASISVTSTDNLVKYANYADAAYADVKVDTWSCSGACKTNATAGTTVYATWNYPKVASTGYMAYNHKNEEIIVAYRGTKTPQGWITNVKYFKDDWPSGVEDSEVHQGFLKAYKASQSFVSKSLSALTESLPTYKIIFVGHSLGGALASLNAADVAQNAPSRIKQMQLFTYGQPRVGNKEFATWMSNRGFPIYRVTYKQDIVPHLPPQLFGFKHFNQEVWYQLSGEPKWCGSTTENKQCQNSVDADDYSTDDHSKYPGL
ncbi:alpha/beta-hydrolase [Linderina pennispora]|uniref:Alpha/beta-hydrolase n=1 Tax=Linderina pennispora TaxID=61395 RepID=A0A1Y1WL62_9FUNG|nr:alpha/beta-hydrolase [Linderina pennispora]ORX74048.1 alpha/beta-hydrolase [Linderina pennispora]